MKNFIRRHISADIRFIKKRAELKFFSIKFPIEWGIGDLFRIILKFCKKWHFNGRFIIKIAFAPIVTSRPETIDSSNPRTAHCRQGFQNLLVCLTPNQTKTTETRNFVHTHPMSISIFFSKMYPLKTTALHGFQHIFSIALLFVLMCH